MSYDYDILVIGAGSGGMAAAKRAAELGANNVAIIEKDAVGGTCVNRGCVPKKWFVYASQYGHTKEAARGFGWDFSASEFTWKNLIKNKDKNIQSLNTTHADRLKDKGVTLIKGSATFIDAYTVEVEGKKISASHIVIATGTAPFIPNIRGREYIATSDDMFDLSALPKRIAVVGGGYIACEFAGIMYGLGAEVTLIHRGDRLLKKLDAEVASHLKQQMAHQGIAINLGTEIQSITRDNTTLALSLSDGNTLHTDGVLFATGRNAELDLLGVKLIGVTTNDRGFIQVNDDYQTSQKHIYAIGDVIGRTPLTPVAIREGRMVAERIFSGAAEQTLDYNLVPTAIFSSPPIGVCGLSEENAKKEGYEVTIHKSLFKPIKNLMTGSDHKTFVKLVVDKASDRVLGVHMVGEDAPEIIQAASVALTCKATKAQFDATVSIHPTAAEELVNLG